MSWHPTSNASFLGYPIMYPLLVWFIIPLRDCNISFTKLWLQATACKFFNVFGRFQLKIASGVSYCEVGWRQPGCRYSSSSKRRVSAVGSIWGEIAHAGAENGNYTAALCKASSICFFWCASENPGWTQTVKVCVAISGYLSTTIKLLQLWRINTASEKQPDIPSTWPTLLL